MDPLVLQLALWPVFLLGLLFGSFLNVVGYRVPRGESISWPPSHCPHCDRRLAPFELVPVLSYVFLRGRCRTCKIPISPRYPALELVTASLFSATVLTGSTPWQDVVWCLFWMLMVAVTATDLTAMRVPNVLSIPGAVLVIIAVILTGIQTWSSCLLGACTGFFVMFLIHLLSGGKMGMGDVKLYISIGAILGPMGAVMSLVLASVAGSIIGLTFIGLQLLSRRTYIPFVPFICLGVVLTVFFGPAWLHWYSVRVLHLG